MTTLYNKMVGINPQLKTEVLREARKTLKMTQEDLANKLGSYRTDISKLERGQKIPDWLIKAIALDRLLKKAGYTFEDLLLFLPDPEDRPRAAESSGRYIAKGD